jgi:hypothetical protein
MIGCDRCSAAGVGGVVCECASLKPRSGVRPGLAAAVECESGAVARGGGCGRPGGGRVGGECAAAECTEGALAEHDRSAIGLREAPEGATCMQFSCVPQL